MKISEMTMDKIIRDGKAIDQLQDKLRESGATRQYEMHLAAISSMEQANDHGNLAFLTRLLKSFCGTERVQEFKYWVHVFSDGRIRFDDKLGEFKQKSDKFVVKGNVSIEAKRIVKYKDADGNWQQQIVRAINTPWWELGNIQTDREKPLFDPEKDKKNLIGAIGRHAKKADDEGFPELADAYRAIEQQLVGEFNAAMRLIARRKAEEPQPEVAKEPEEAEEVTGNR